MAAWNSSWHAVTPTPTPVRGLGLPRGRAEESAAAGAQEYRGVRILPLRQYQH
jgi:hypothetical protein